MKMEKSFRVTGNIAFVTAISLAIVGLIFRSFVWASWLPYNGDPYGPSDILELLIFFAIALSSGVCVIAGIGLLFVQPRTFRILVAGIIVPVVYFLLHSLVPTFKLW
jgi:hypothetical protein